MQTLTGQRELPEIYPVIAGYRLREEMGRGPFGAIYRATSWNDMERVVMRGIMRPLAMDEGRWRETKARFIDLLSRHQRTADMAGAPSTLQKIVGFGEGQDLFWIASEYFEARNLEQILAEEGAQSFHSAMAILRQVAEALDWAARYGLHHSDVTPTNILVVQDRFRPLLPPHVEVINFGLAHTRRKFGSRFAAPEVQQGHRGDSRADVYSTGALLYELLSNRPLFSGTPEEIAEKARNAMPAPLVGMPVFVQNVINKMLAKDPIRRYERVSDALADLEAQRSPTESRRFPVAGVPMMPRLTQIAPHLGVAGSADDGITREQLEMERLPELARGTAYIPL